MSLPHHLSQRTIEPHTRNKPQGAAMESIMDRNPRKALGRGLAALIPTATPSEGLRHLPIEQIRPNPHQPRKQFDDAALSELADSIRTSGLLQPIIVRRADDGYEIVAGERRWRAAARAGLNQIPVVIKELSDTGALQAALVENLQRQDLDPLEEAEAFARLMREHSMSQEDVAQAVGKSRAAVANSVRLLNLPDPILQMLADGRLTAGHARALMTLQNQDDMLRLAEDIARRRASVREVEAKARMINRSRHEVTRSVQSPAVVDLQEKLTRSLGTKVRLHDRRGKGRIEIFFHSYEHLDDILNRLPS